MSSALKPIVYVVDDDLSIRESISSLLRAEGMQVEVFDSPLAFLAKDDLNELGCLVLDVRMPGLDGLELQSRLVAKGLKIPIVFITGHGDVPMAVRAMKGGAVDFLNKPFDSADLLAAISSALAKSLASRLEESGLEALQKRYESLTCREKQIVSEVARGKANKIIAIDLDVAESTVKVHRHNAMKKLGMRSVAELSLVMEKLKNAAKLA